MKEGPTDRFEQGARELGFDRIAGIDEAGRGALAGPVVAAAVILPESFDVEGVTDSKLIREDRRERLYERIVERAAYVGVGIVDNRTIDEINILRATFRAMQQAAEGLAVRANYFLIDGNVAPDLGAPSQAIVKGDARSLSIAAASIVAKVTRDRIMRGEHENLPLYDFVRNKGYGTLAHRDALLKHGPSPLHRLTFLGRILHARFPL